MPIAEELLTRINLGVMYPPFVAKLPGLLESCMQRGYVYYATSGLRTMDEQAKLYAIGRTTGNPGHHVTNARPGQSPHNWGIACDFTKDNDSFKPGLQPGYNPEDYRPLAEEGVNLRLDSGFYWKSLKDLDHLALPFHQRGISLAMFSQAYAQGGYPSVFRLLDKFGPW